MLLRAADHGLADRRPRTISDRPRFINDGPVALPDDATAHIGWADRVDAGLAPHALPGGYPNMLGPDAHEQTAHAYGGNATRLGAVKMQFDPDGVFSAIGLPG
ncbi:BBE domain-containing protein [Mycobacterium stomatepiae]|uniref:Berberine/berberine-like domain-containing protein n=1 Tax=Mycobacterium stomatepiae TaxID=470076 RepID=A0A7I7QED0_9MYCO|nr:BBE domain-containing protein [Mycobacterium stomatepiae]MCV7167428.1 BBE domain-containing protein [Mycobacterium stomatepiae]BBY24482.1 hypothetical protein MSTO_46870 [Mycobacterium stomatepiae]